MSRASLRVSKSYSFDEIVTSTEYATYPCKLFAQLRARGVSVLFSRSNFGVGVGNCMTSDGSFKFRPRFPASCPYVTNVGGATGFEPEVAAKFSSDGFSTLFPRPEYQDRVVSAFLKNLGSQYKDLYECVPFRDLPKLFEYTVTFVQKFLRLIELAFEVQRSILARTAPRS
ncbi:peptidase S8/S53 domain-containing protein [Lactarius quietus]|nr:peptidase S8/S53 domain-containing protein [Lactarius quietus]